MTTTAEALGNLATQMDKLSQALFGREDATFDEMMAEINRLKEDAVTQRRKIEELVYEAAINHDDRR